MADIGTGTSPFKSDPMAAAPSLDRAQSAQASLEGDDPASALGGTMPITGGMGAVPVIIPATTITPKASGPADIRGSMPGEYQTDTNERGDVHAGDVAQQARNQLPSQEQVGGALEQARNQLPSQEQVGRAVQQARDQLPSQEQVGGAIEQARSQLPSREQVGDVVQQGRDQLPAQQDVTSAVKSFAQSAASYLPQSIADTVYNLLPTAQASVNDTIHDKSLPTQETQGAQPSELVSGAGALPGGPHEEAVAKLPGEESTGLPREGVSGYMGPSADWKPSDAIPKDQSSPAPDVPSMANLSLNSSSDTPTADTHGSSPMATGAKAAGTAGFVAAAYDAAAKDHHNAEALPTSTSSESAAQPSFDASRDFKAPARPEDMVSKSHDWPDARSQGSVSRSQEKPLPPVVNPDAGISHDKPMEELAMYRGANTASAPKAMPLTADAGSYVPTPPPASAPTSTKHSNMPTTDAAENSAPALAIAATTTPVKSEGLKNATAVEHKAGSDEIYHYNKPTAPVAASQPVMSTRTQDSAHSEDSETRHKATLAEKVKGEMKIISGKLGGDKSKVDEGNKLKSGLI